MPLRHEGQDWIRDPLSAAPPKDYLAHKDDPARVLEFYEYSRDDMSRKAPDGWTLSFDEEKDDRGRIILTDRSNDSCVEVTYKLVDGVKTDFAVHPLSREEAYRRALDQDDLHIEFDGTRIFNERHSRPAS